MQNTNNTNPEFVRALDLEAAGDFAGAEVIYERLVTGDQSFASAQINLGTIMYNRKGYAGAKRCYEAALAIDPDYALAHFNLANVLDETKQPAAAVYHYKRGLSIDPQYADCHYNLALLYQQLGNKTDAAKHWHAYLKLDNTGPWADHARLMLARNRGLHLVHDNPSPKLTDDRATLHLV